MGVAGPPHPAEVKPCAPTREHLVVTSVIMATACGRQTEMPVVQ